MTINIASLHFTARPQLNDFVLEKVSHLERFNQKILSGDVCLKLDRSSTNDNKICEIKLEIPGENLFAKSQCQTFEEATTKTVEVLKQQMLKRKDAHSPRHGKATDKE